MLLSLSMFLRIVVLIVFGILIYRVASKHWDKAELEDIINKAKKFKIKKMYEKQADELLNSDEKEIIDDN